MIVVLRVRDYDGDMDIRVVVESAETRLSQGVAAEKRNGRHGWSMGEVGEKGDSSSLTVPKYTNSGFVDSDDCVVGGPFTLFPSGSKLPGDWAQLAFLFYPLITFPNDDANLEIFPMLIDGTTLATGIFEAGLFVLAVAVWVHHERPGLEPVRARWKGAGSG